MKCPVCQLPLKSGTVGTTRVATCPQCGGAWFDGDSLRLAKDTVAPDAKWFDFDLWNQPELFRISDTDHHCPNCEKPLHRLHYGDSPLVIGACKDHHGIWLERGEFEKIVAYVRDQSGRELIQHYLKHWLEEGAEIVTGHEGLISEAEDFFVITKLFQYKFAGEHPVLAQAFLNLPK